MSTSSATTSSSSYLLLCIGHPLLDIQVRKGAERLLKKYKLKEDDGILAGVEQEGIYDEIAQGYEATYVAGGAAQNTARGAAYILPPNTVAFTGCVGDDEFAEQLRAANKREGVLELYQVKKGEKTGMCAVIVNGDNRSLVTNLRSAKMLEEYHLHTPKLNSVIENIKVLYITSFMLTHNPDIVINLAERVSREGKLVVLNLSAPYIPRIHNSSIQRIIPHCGIVIANEAEALSWAEVNGIPLNNNNPSTSSSESEDHNDLPKDNRRRSGSSSSPHPSVPQIAKTIALLPKFSTPTTYPSSSTIPQANNQTPSVHTEEEEDFSRIVLITSGSHSTTLVHSSYPDEPRSYPVPPLKPHELVDTNAAGDAFAGGFLAAYIRLRVLGLSLGSTSDRDIVGERRGEDVSSGVDVDGGLSNGRQDCGESTMTWLDECVKMGHWLAGMCCGQVGGQYRWPKVDVLHST
ncbi:Ribokinase-like protein [Dendrothele bispora CBS 962.96]|uniref:adenosine kinase n=1 Tax=Dendrothele bispora (strain CBS 962.96) TaxID=1314807 RepID=A0A4S8LBQ3_DENBC|nr:Ribokinase-like protein [Dendrothele bispora CBS 962.96]